MRISNIEYTKHKTYNQLWANIGKLPLWYRFPSAFDTDPLDASCFVCIALVPAMLLGEDLLVDEPYTISSQLSGNLSKIQEMYHCWNPVFKRIHVVSNTRGGERQGSGCGSFFSGGVDGTYSVLKHISEIDYLVLINGFDFCIPTPSWNAMVERNTSFAARLGKYLVPVETNWFHFTKEYGLVRPVTYGSCLASIAQMLGFSKALISATETFKELLPDGGHPLLCPLWSTEKTSMVHTGLEADRAGKLHFIAKNPDAVSNLWVCWDSPDYNCGRCSKCVRTYVALRLNDITGCPFKEKVRIADVARQPIKNNLALSYYLEFQRLAKEKGDVQIAKRISRLIGRYKLKLWFSDMDKYYCSGVLRTSFLTLRDALNKLLGRQREPMFIKLMPQQPDDGERLRLVQAKFADPHFKPETLEIGSVFLQPDE